MKTVKNTSTYPISLHSGPSLAPGEFGDTTNDDPAIKAGLVTVAEGAPDPAEPPGEADTIAEAPEGVDATPAHPRRSRTDKEVS